MTFPAVFSVLVNLRLFVPRVRAIQLTLQDAIADKARSVLANSYVFTPKDQGQYSQGFIIARQLPSPYLSTRRVTKRKPFFKECIFYKKSLLEGTMGIVRLSMFECTSYLNRHCTIKRQLWNTSLLHWQCRPLPSLEKNVLNFPAYHILSYHSHNYTRCFFEKSILHKIKKLSFLNAQEPSMFSTLPKPYIEPGTTWLAKKCSTLSLNSFLVSGRANLELCNESKLCKLQQICLFLRMMSGLGCKVLTLDCLTLASGSLLVIPLSAMRTLSRDQKVSIRDATKTLIIKRSWW